MRLRHYKSVTTTSFVEIEVPAGADHNDIENAARVHRELHGKRSSGIKERHGMLNRMRKKAQNLIIHCICDWNGIISAVLFKLLAGRVHLCYDVLSDERDYDELNRVEPKCYFITGKKK